MRTYFKAKNSRRKPREKIHDFGLSKISEMWHPKHLLFWHMFIGSYKKKISKSAFIRSTLVFEVYQQENEKLKTEKIFAEISNEKFVSKKYKKRLKYIVRKFFYVMWVTIQRIFKLGKIFEHTLHKRYIVFFMNKHYTNEGI